MNRVVLDASAVTAVLREEPGHINVLPYLSGALISSVNLAEVLCSLRKLGSNPELDAVALNAMRFDIIPFDADQAQIVASIYEKTKGSTVGLADRVCMALGLLHGVPILTGDHDWKQHDVGVEIILFRQRREG